MMLSDMLTDVQHEGANISLLGAGIPGSVSALRQELQRDCCREAHPKMPGHHTQADTAPGGWRHWRTSESAERQGLKVQIGATCQIHGCT